MLRKERKETRDEDKLDINISSLFS